MPGKSFAGAQPPLSANELEIQHNLERHINKLATEIGVRNMSKPAKLAETAEYIATNLSNLGYKVARQEYSADGALVCNIEAELSGTTKADEIILLGAHYDSANISPGANDNASGVAGVLELARLFAGKNQSRTIRFVLFTYEEPPYFATVNMGSAQYADRCAARNENIVAMIALETFGYYNDTPNSQSYPLPFLQLLYPNTGNFVAFIGNMPSDGLVRSFVKTFRQTTPFPSQGITAPEVLPGVDWSDQMYFWKHGYPGVMVTDTAVYRYPYYHTANDTEDNINFPAMARVVGGMERIIQSVSQ